MNSDFGRLEDAFKTSQHYSKELVHSPKSPRARNKVPTIKELFAKLIPKKPHEPDPKHTVQAVLEEGRNFVTATETIANRCKNIAVIDLTLPDGMRADRLAGSLIEELAEFKKADEEKRETLPKVQGKEVEENDRKIVKTFIGELLDNEELGRKVLAAVIQRKDDIAHNRAYLSSSVLVALFLEKTANEKILIAKHLMSECTESKGPYRTVKPEMLTLLLQEQRLEDLYNEVKDAAQAVMIEAIRKCQSNIVFQAMQASATRKDDSAKWLEASKRHGDNYLTVSGVCDIARQVGLTLYVKENPGDENQKHLKDLYEVYVTVLSCG